MAIGINSCWFSIDVGFLLDDSVLTKLWAWFVVTTFGVASLSFVQAIGVSLVVGYVTSHYNNYDPQRSHYTLCSFDWICCPFVYVAQ